MMQFRIVGEAIKTLLASYAGGAFTVIGHQKSGKAPESTATGCTVEVFLHRDDFPKQGGSMAGPNRGDLTFNLTLTASKAASVNLAVLEDSSAANGEISAALSAMQESGAIADAAIDELFENVYQIIMDARNMDLGLTPGDVSSRWIGQFLKDVPILQGNYTVVTGTALLTCTVSEQVVGYSEPTITPVIDLDLEVQSDESAPAGVLLGD
jgi:hypothetical protein